jgi:hypothetical protein
LIWAGTEEIGDQLQPDVLFAELEVGRVVLAGVWGSESVTAADEAPHPGAAILGGHHFDKNAIVKGAIRAVALDRGFDLTSVAGVVVGH